MLLSHLILVTTLKVTHFAFNFQIWLKLRSGELEKTTSLVKYFYKRTSETVSLFSYWYTNDSIVGRESHDRFRGEVSHLLPKSVVTSVINASLLMPPASLVSPLSRLVCSRGDLPGRCLPR